MESAPSLHINTIWILRCSLNAVVLMATRILRRLGRFTGTLIGTSCGPPTSVSVLDNTSLFADNAQGLIPRKAEILPIPSKADCRYRIKLRCCRYPLTGIHVLPISRYLYDYKLSLSACFLIVYPFVPKSCCIPGMKEYDCQGIRNEFNGYPVKPPPPARGTIDNPNLYQVVRNRRFSLWYRMFKIFLMHGLLV